MPNSKEIKNRINSVKDTQKITNAMYLIASTKLRKAKRNFFETLPYFEFLRSEASKILNNVVDIESKYFLPIEDNEEELDLEGTTAILCISADKGLAGAYNQNVIKQTLKLIEEHKDYSLFVVGEYARTYFRKHGYNIDNEFDFTAQDPNMDRARSISSLLLDKYESGLISQIFIVYTEYELNSATDVRYVRMLPFHPSHFDINEEIDTEDLFEIVPSLNEVLDTIARNYSTGFIYSCLVESFCAEQNSRMMAMDNANENAKELLSELNVKYNKIRQNLITMEITEVSSGARSLKQIKEALN